MADVQITKVCTNCKRAKAIDKFGLHSANKDGRQFWCKQCKSDYHAACKADPQRHTKMKQRHLIAQRTRRATPAGREKELAFGRKLRSSPEGRAKLKAAFARWSATEKGKATKRRGMARYYATTHGKAKTLATQRADRIANKEKYKIRQAKRRATDKGRLVTLRNNAKRRAMKKGATVGDIGLIAEWESTWRNAKSVACHWCGKKFPGKACHADHRVPLSKGGLHDVENLVVACERCNLSKHDKQPEHFNASLQQPWLFF